LGFLTPSPLHPCKADTVVGGNATPYPADIGGALSWYIEWGSDPAGDATLSPSYSTSGETSLLTAIEPDMGVLTVDYSYMGETATDTAPLTIIGLDVSPDTVDIGINDTVQLEAKPYPSTGGSLQWSVIQGGGGVAGTFSPSSSDTTPVFTGTGAGTGWLKCAFTYNAKTYSEIIPLTVRDVEITTAPSVIPVGEYDTFVASCTPDHQSSGGVLTWSLIEGPGSGTFTPNNDTTVVLMAEQAGTTLVHVKYEGAGLTQGYDEDTAPCAIIKVEIDSVPAWICLGDTTTLHCTPTLHADARYGCDVRDTHLEAVR